MNLFTGFYVLSYNIRLKIIMPENEKTISGADQQWKIPGDLSPPLQPQSSSPNQSRDLIFFNLMGILEISAN